MLKKIFPSIVIISLVSSVFLGAYPAFAFQKPAMITFTFDDGDKSIYNLAAPLLSNYHIPAVFYGETGPLNAGEDWIMTWDQVRGLRDIYGWEIGSHSITHPYLTKVSDDVLIKEIANSKKQFAAHGIIVKSFATPYGDYNPKVISTIARYYESHRAAWGGPNVWPSIYNDYEIVTKEISNTTTPLEVSQWVDEAVSNKQWLVLLLHKIVEGEANEYEYNFSNLKEIVSYVSQKPIQAVTISQGLHYSDQPNLIPNSGFSNLDSTGWAKNWTRTSETNVMVDRNNNGNVFGLAKSLKIIGGVQQNEALTKKISIDPSKEYILRMYQNVQDLTAGGWAVYIDEFGAKNNWLGGQWLGGNYSNFVGYRYYQYKPSSTNVSKIQIHIFTEENSQLTLYVDSVELKVPNLVIQGPASQSNPTVTISTSLTVESGD
jgi:peptidoglycan/xylan/chitin deacetylase (PgdA/CDA1 family)